MYVHACVAIGDRGWLSPTVEEGSSPFTGAIDRVNGSERRSQRSLQNCGRGFDSFRACYESQVTASRITGCWSKGKISASQAEDSGSSPEQSTGSLHDHRVSTRCSGE